MIVKYKAWDKSEKKMKQVYSIKFNEQGEAISIQDEFADNYETYVTYDVKYYELLQSTGLFDKNGTEIFEGDILSISKNHSKTDSSVFNDEKVNYEVEFLIYNDFEEYADIEHYGWCVTGSIDDWYTRCTLIDAVKLWDAEIVGNIYQDEHLLGED